MRSRRKRREDDFVLREDEKAEHREMMSLLSTDRTAHGEGRSKVIISGGGRGSACNAACVTVQNQLPTQSLGGNG